jgi:hypothetical protein
MRRTRLIVALLLALLVSLCAVDVAVAAVPADTSRLRSAVDSAGILKLENKFQEIADENKGTRTSGTPGYDASAK